MSCFFERINTIDKPLHSSLKRRDSQINKIRNEKGEIISHTTTEIQKKKKENAMNVICQQIEQPRRNG